MAIITLTSDWGTSDYYLAAVKGAFLTQLPEAAIVDIAHDIAPFDLESAAFTVRNCYRQFPAGTIHIVAVNTEESKEHPHIAIRSGNQYFIGTDNGVFYMILGNEVDEAYEIDIIQDTNYFTFSTRDRFVKAAAHIAHGFPLAGLGEKREAIVQRYLFEPVTSLNEIKGMVVHVDGYENAITNISKELFDQIGKKRSFEIHIAGYVIKKIRLGYTYVGTAELLALFGTHGMLELAINQGKAASLCGFWRNTRVQIKFS